VPWPTDLALINDLISASQFNRLPCALAEATGAAATYDFTSIPAHWTHLVVLCNLKGSSGAADDMLWFRPNADGNANYYIQRFRIAGGATTGNDETALSIGRVGRLSGVAAGAPNAFLALIPDYAAAQAHSVVAVSFTNDGTGAGARDLNFHGFLWNQAVAINRLQIGIEGGSSFVAGSTATLYGMGQV
jgi:hypothetical protein